VKIRSSGQQKSGLDKVQSQVSRQEKKSGESKTAKQKFDWKQLPDVLALIKPRSGVLALGFGLMVINRVSGLILPASTKYLVDNVIGKRQVHLLTPIVLAVVTATIIQGLTSYSLTQLLSKSSWRMISEMREKVQAHIGRLQIAYYDANKTGVLVSRIMSDVEGVRNLIGTGLIEFLGGIMTAILALVILLRISVTMTAVAFAVLLLFGVGLNRAFKTIRPIFRARPKINAEVTGRLTESLAGVRVVGRHDRVDDGQRPAPHRPHVGDVADDRRGAGRERVGRHERRGDRFAAQHQEPVAVADQRRVIAVDPDPELADQLQIALAEQSRRRPYEFGQPVGVGGHERLSASGGCHGCPGSRVGGVQPAAVIRAARIARCLVSQGILRYSGTNR